MTRKVSRNSFCSVHLPFVAILIALVAMADQARANQQFARPAVVAAQQNANALALQRPLSAGGGKRRQEAGPHRRR